MEAVLAFLNFFSSMIKILSGCHNLILCEYVFGNEKCNFKNSHLKILVLNFLFSYLQSVDYTGSLSCQIKERLKKRKEKGRMKN